MVVSPDNRWLAFTTDPDPEQPCPGEYDRLHVLDATGAERLPVAHAGWFTWHLLDNGLLLGGHVAACDQWELGAYVLDQGALVRLASVDAMTWFPRPVSLSERVVLVDRTDWSAT